MDSPQITPAASSSALTTVSGGGFLGWLSENKQGITLTGCVLVLLALAGWYIWNMKKEQEEKIKHIKRKMTKTAHEYAEKRLAKEIAAKSADSAAGTPTTFQQQQQQQQLIAQQQQQFFLAQQQQQQYAAYLQAQQQAQAQAQAQAQSEVDPTALANTMAYLAANPEALAAAMQQQRPPVEDNEEEEEDEGSEIDE